MNQASGRTLLPTLRQLQFLVALRAEGSFSRAAQAVGVTQPTLSAGIKELECLLGAILVERGRAGAVLTSAGQDAAERAIRAINEVEELVHAVQGGGAPLIGDFRLGAIPTIAPYLLPRLVPALRRAYPSLRLFLREDLTARLIEGLRARTLDAALIALPYVAQGVDSLALFDDEFLLAIAPDHKLARSENLQQEDLAGEEILLLEDGHCLREHALAMCARAPNRQGAEVGATSLTTLAHMVAGGIGVTLMPRLALENGAVAGAELITRQFQKPMIGRSIGLAWRAKSPRQKEALLIADLVKRLANRAG